MLPTSARAKKIVQMFDRLVALQAESNEGWSRVFAGDGDSVKARRLAIRTERLMVAIGRLADNEKKDR